MTRDNGNRLRHMVLSRGNTVDSATLYRRWRGRDPEIDPMLRDRGLTGLLAGESPVADTIAG